MEDTDCIVFRSSVQFVRPELAPGYSNASYLSSMPNLR